MYKIFVVWLVLVSISFAQDLTFEKEYDLYPGHYVYETLDGGILITAIAENKKAAQVIRMDQKGNVKWVRKFDLTIYCTPQAIETNDSSIFYVSTQNSIVKLTKLSSASIVQWEKDYPFEGSSYGLSVKEVEGNNLLLSGFVSRSNKRFVFIIKTDSSGSVIWKKEYNFGQNNYSLVFPAMSIKSLDNKIYLHANNIIYILSAEGDSLKIINSVSVITSFEKLESGFITTGDKFISRLDEEGNQLWNKSFRGRITSICRTDDNNFIINEPAGLTKISPEADTIWNIESTVSPLYISKIRSGAFLAVGKYLYNNLGLLKIRPHGYYAVIKLFYPRKGELINSGSEYRLQIYSKGVNKVSLDLSTDNEKTWKLNEAVGNASNFKWEVPFVNSDSCRIRINDLSGNAESAISNIFSIRYYPLYDIIAVNNIKMWVGSNGITAHDPNLDGSGLYWPKGHQNSYGSELSAVFVDGLLWGGLVNGVLHVNGSAFRSGLQPSEIPSPGIWNLQRDWQNTTGTLRKKYEYHYNTWPGEYGAPFTDVDNDGRFTKGIDLPRILGDQTLWYSANDFDTTASNNVFVADPIGIEMQSTTYAYNTGDELDDVIFKKYKIINKSGKEVKDMYLSYWSDADLGNPFDDFTGCDTLLNLGYIYNGDNIDEGYYELNPPAIGYKLLQGPIIPGAVTDTAVFDNRRIPGKKNLHMIAFHPDLKNSRYSFPDGAKQWYNQMQGKLWDGSDAVNALTGKTTRFPLSGDPVAGIGWYEGPGWPGGEFPYERRFLMSAGPFVLAAADTQEVVYAVILARGASNINSVAELKRKARIVQDFYDNIIFTDVHQPLSMSYEYSLSQNFPNPFNPSTTIIYSVPEKTNVELSIYTVLGEKVTTLLNEEKRAGEYRVNFNAFNISSGIYYYQLKTNAFVSTRKMVFVR